MAAFALDDDWTEIDADTYTYEEDEYGTQLLGRALIEIPAGRGRHTLKYFGIFETDDTTDWEADEELATDE
jgi:hypothetical protein